MKKLFIIATLLIAMTMTVAAQQKLTPQSQKLFDACWALRTAISSGNTSSLKSANTAFKSCKAGDFSSLRLISPKQTSLNGFFVWDEDFVDELIAGRNARKFAQKYAENRAVRGASGKGGYVKTLMVKKNGNTKFSFTTRDLEELSIITEPGGKLTIRLYDTKAKKWYNDTEDVKRGREFRTHIVKLPKNVVTTWEVEVINCSKKDFSFAVLSN